MKFSWSYALYRAFRWAMIGALTGFVLSLIVGLYHVPVRFSFIPIVIFLFCSVGIGRLAWEAFTKDYPDA